jgi:predicted acyl esterase
MMGISWGGFNSLQVAALAPPALKAIITLCSTDDRYADDAHYMGGCLLNENMQWGSVLLNHGAYPPDPQIVGERWRAMWRERIDDLVPFPRCGCSTSGATTSEIRLGVRGLRRDRAPSMRSAAGRTAAERRAAAMRGLSCPERTDRPRAPLPAQRRARSGDRPCRRRCAGDHWLKGIDTGIMAEPPLRIWMQESVDPQPYHEERPGRWVAEPSWPPGRIEKRRYYLNPGRLEPTAGRRVMLAFSSPQTTGLRAGEWCAFGAEGEMPLDQRADDGRSLAFDSEPLPARMEILGAPVVELDLAVDEPSALLAVRLNDVQPDGTSTLVTYGLLNLTHRESHDQPTA